MSIILACALLPVLTAGIAGAAGATPEQPAYHDAKLSTVWYLAEGCTINMETWVLVQNPNAEATTVSLSLFTDGGNIPAPELQNVPLPGYTRQTYHLNAYVSTFNVSTKVTTGGGEVVCERAMYGPGRQWATDSIGVRATDTDWYLAEGCTAGGMETWILVQNPNDYEARVNLSFCTDTGPENPAATEFVIPAKSRHSINLGVYLGNDRFNLGTRVHCVTGDVICERSMYGPGREWATNSIGCTSTDYDWLLAEGCTVDMETWVLIMNPGTTDSAFSVTFMTEDGAKPGPQNVTINAGSRVSVNAGLYVTGFNVSTEVTGSSFGLVVERSMYGPGRQWATNSIGVSRNF
jgi:hypothetical protein